MEHPVTTATPEEAPKDRLDRWAERHPLLLLATCLGFFLSFISAVQVALYGGLAEVVSWFTAMSPSETARWMLPMFGYRRLGALLLAMLGALVSLPIAWASGWALRLTWRWKRPVFWVSMSLVALVYLLNDPGGALVAGAWGVAVVVVVWLIARHFANQEAILEELRRTNGRRDGEDA